MNLKIFKGDDEPVPQPVYVEICNDKSITLRKQDTVYRFEQEDLPMVIDLLKFVQFSGLHRVEAEQAKDVLINILEGKIK